MPKVSVIIPNYNHARFLEKRIASVLNQSYRDYEVILMDDASTDESRDIIYRYCECPDFKIVINQVNSGSPFKQWNKGIQIAEGEYIWIAESDDEAEPDLLETLVNRLDTSSSIVLAYCQSIVIDATGNKHQSMSTWTDDLDTRHWSHDFIARGTDECLHYLAVKNTIPNASAVLFRKESFLKIDTETNMRLCGDWLLWSRLISLGSVSFCARPMNYFRQHEETIRSNTRRVHEDRELLAVTSEIVSRLKLSTNDKEELASKLYSFWKIFLTVRNPGHIYPHFYFLYKLDPLKAFWLLLFLFLRGCRAVAAKIY